jgi:hypothetical protein
MALRIGDEAPDGQGIHVAIGDQAVAGQDEGYLRVFRQLGVELGDDSRGHVERAVFLVQAVRGFDFAHLLARRHVDREKFLDAFFLA